LRITLLRTILVMILALLVTGCQNGLTGSIVKETSVRSLACGEEQSILIKGQSMEPTLQNGEEVKAIIGYYGCHAPARGDIVLFKRPDGLGVKRIAAIPDDTWKVKERTLFINGKVATRDGRAYAITPKMQSFLQQYASFSPLPAEHYFLLADYTGNAYDSRRIGVIAKSDIVGKIVLKGGSA